MNFVVVSLVSLKGIMAFGAWENQVPKVLFLDEWKSADNTGLSTNLVAAWRRLQVQSGVKFDRQTIQEIFVVSGPGSFTGIRVGASFAAGLAYGLGISAYSIPTFDLFAEAVGVPVRTHLAMQTLAADCAASNIEFLFQAKPNGVECRLPQAGEMLLGVADAAAEFKEWPTRAQIVLGLKRSEHRRQPLQPEYGIGPKISGVRIGPKAALAK